MSDETYEEMLARYQAQVAGSIVPPIGYNEYVELFRGLLTMIEQDVPHKHILVAHGDDLNSSCLRCRLDFAIHVINHFNQMLTMTVTLDSRLATLLRREQDAPLELKDIGWAMFNKLFPSAPASNAPGN